MAAIFTRLLLAKTNFKFQIIFRCKSSSTFAVIYNEYGDPNKMLNLAEMILPSPGIGEVVVQILAAPINPADINMIQGVYAIKPPLPAIGGNEGVGKVIQISPDVNDLNVGDWVIPAAAGMGTWRTHLVCKSDQLIKVPNDISVFAAATLAVNPCTAYRMLRDFKKLNPGDVVIQNGANSAVGQAVIQIAKDMKLRTVNIIRDRPQLQETIDNLKSLGASEVITEEFCKSVEMANLMKFMPKPKLALNCVGGKSAVELLRQLDHNGSMVTYGGMSKQPVTVPTSLLIFKNVSVLGFWMSKWNELNSKSEERYKMLTDICNMIKTTSLKIPKYSPVPLKEFSQGILKAMESFGNEKQILVNENIEEN